MATSLPSNPFTPHSYTLSVEVPGVLPHHYAASHIWYVLPGRMGAYEAWGLTRRRRRQDAYQTA